MHPISKEDFKILYDELEVSIIKIFLVMETKWNLKNKRIQYFEWMGKKSCIKANS
jgi:hypothetical protein